MGEKMTEIQNQNEGDNAPKPLSKTIKRNLLLGLGASMVLMVYAFGVDDARQYYKTMIEQEYSVIDCIKNISQEKIGKIEFAQQFMLPEIRKQYDDSINLYTDVNRSLDSIVIADKDKDFNAINTKQWKSWFYILDK
jgi:hypothetical protein